MRACWLKWVGRDWSISADCIWLNYSGANSRGYLGFFDWGGCYIAESLRDEDCFSKALDVRLVTHIFSRQNDKKLYDSLLNKDGDFDDSQLPRTIKSLIDPCLLAH